MLIISDELKNFKEVVTTEAVEQMNSKTNTLTENLTSLTNSCTIAEDGFSAYYSSENKNTILNKFSNINEILKTISTSISSDLQSILSKSLELTNNVTELMRLSEEVSTQDGIRSTELGKELEDRDNTVISEANRIISDDTRKFNELKTTSENLLIELKSMDANLDFVSKYTSNDYLAYLDALQYGTFEKKTFVSSEGVKVSYYIYIPDYGSASVEKIPVHMYLHGSGESGDGVLSCGLPKMINDKSIISEGIVICPQSVQGNEFYHTDYHNALIELIDSVIEEKNGDPDKISLSGHSMGAICGYRMIAKHPDYFSAFVPISGYCDADINGLTDTAIWAFHGSEDARISYVDANNAVRKINNAGGNASLYTLQGKGHAYVQDYTFENEFEDSEGEMINPLSWAYKQKRKKNNEKV